MLVVVLIMRWLTESASFLKLTSRPQLPTVVGKTKGPFPAVESVSWYSATITARGTELFRCRGRRGVHEAPGWLTRRSELANLNNVRGLQPELVELRLNHLNLLFEAKGVKVSKAPSLSP